MKEKLKESAQESLSAILPIILIVFGFTLFISPMPVGTLMLFLGGAALLIFGMSLLTSGMDMVLVPLGYDIGASMTGTHKIVLISIVSFVIGTAISFAGPDLWVLARLVPGVDDWIVLITASIGAGLSLLLAVMRIIFHIQLSKILVVSYGILLLLAVIAPGTFVPVGFDAGGVVTGPVSVPFILALGLGIAYVRSDKESLDDSFGLVALCVIGPVVAMLLVGLFSEPADFTYIPPTLPVIETTQDVFFEFLGLLPYQVVGVAQSIWPVFAVFIGYQLVSGMYHRRQFLRMLVGFIYTYAGLILFMMGVEIGFIPAGTFLGSDLANSNMRWMLVPFGAVIGYYVVAAEPAIHALKKQIEEVSLGVIPGITVQRYLSVGVAVALALTMLRVMYGIPIYWLLFPSYLAAVVLTFFVPKIYTGIAFDTAGAVTGPITSSFILPFVIGACIDPDRIMLDAFGTVGLVAMTPPVSLQVMGLVYNKKMQETIALSVSDQAIDETDDDVIVLNKPDKIEETQEIKSNKNRASKKSGSNKRPAKR